MKLAGKTILITGGCGLIGSTLADRLLLEEPTVRIILLDNLTRGTRFNVELALSSGRVQLVEEDIRHFDRIRSWFDGVDGVFHQAAIRITRCAQEPRECVEVLIDGTLNVLQACVDANVQKVVAASSASVYGLADEFPTAESHHPYNNRTLYGAAKAANEAMLRSFNDMYGLKYVALRYFNVYGPEWTCSANTPRSSSAGSIASIVATLRKSSATARRRWISYSPTTWPARTVWP